MGPGLAKPDQSTQRGRSGHSSPKNKFFRLENVRYKVLCGFGGIICPGNPQLPTMACPPVPFGGPFVDRRSWHGSDGPWVGGMGNGAQLDLRRLRSRVSPSWAVWSRAGHQSDTQARRPRGLGRWTMRSSTEAQTAICEVETQTVLCERPSLRFSVQYFCGRRRAQERTSGTGRPRRDDQRLSTGHF